MQKCSTQNSSLIVNYQQTVLNYIKQNLAQQQQQKPRLIKSPCKKHANINPFRLKWCSCTVLHNKVELLLSLPCMTHGESWTKSCIRERDAAHTQQCIELFPPYCIPLQGKHLLTFGTAIILLTQLLRLFLNVSNGEAFQFVNIEV